MEEPRHPRRTLARWIVGTLMLAALVNGAILAIPYADPATTPVSALPVEHVTSAETTAPVVYRTFDAGNAPDSTVPALLALLEEEDIQATFFLTGRWTVLHPSAARDVAEAGHVLANHSFNHPHIPRWPHAIQRAEVWWADRTIATVCGRPPLHLFRPPHGDTTPEVERYFASLGWRTVMWTKDPSDWRLDGSVTIQSIRAKIEPIENGDVVCFHLRNMETVDALRVIIPELKAQGFEFRTLEDVGME